MGFYDEQVEQAPEQKRKRSRAFPAGLAGAVLGGLIMVSSISLLGEKHATKAPEESAGGQTSSQSIKNVAVNVHSKMTEAVNKTMDAVVGVANLQNKNLNDATDGESGSGSGVIYKKEGGKAYIVTNHHVIAGANQIEVSLRDHKKVQAKVVGSDELMDLAVLEIDGSKVTKVAELGNSDHLQTGESVIAIGNPLGYLEGTVTKGIVSTPERTMPIDWNNDGVDDWQVDVIQTDASINPGNSGGALINQSGQLIGINSMKIAQDGVEGIGFAIPINEAKPIMKRLEKYGHVKRPSIGISPISLSEVQANDRQQTLHLPESVNYGAVIVQVETNSPAQRAGLRELDVITSLDGQKIDDAVELRNYLYTKKKIGDQVAIDFYRQGKKHSVKLTLVQNETNQQ
ncbi:S1C family serine protease [Fictibacillus gelatini]|uniref:S1C family serine protease n=1 Tax=Fictibacillus gelatini TaxID=225985 RepID=UPI0003FCF76D|nr:trypsin-like peptidase domain-containing protein [Fictibacillus gelatini]